MAGKPTVEKPARKRKERGDQSGGKEADHEALDYEEYSLNFPKTRKL